MLSVCRLTVHLSHGSDVVVWIFEADEAVAFGLSCTFVSHHLRTKQSCDDLSTA